jgi:transposase InsO family protein
VLESVFIRQRLLASLEIADDLCDEADHDGRPNQVWAADITYIPIGRGFLYLVAVIDWFTRAVLAWRLSNTIDAAFRTPAGQGRPAADHEPGRMNMPADCLITLASTPNAFFHSLLSP